MNTSRLIGALIAPRLRLRRGLAQSAGDGFVDRNINQQQRIEQGLQSGQLNTREASKLEREQSRVEKMESKAMRDGNVSAQEAQRINNAQNRVSQDIYREKHDAQTGNPNSPHLSACRPMSSATSTSRSASTRACSRTS